MPRFLVQVHMQINHAHSNKLMWARASCMLKITWPNLTFITDVITISTHAHQQSNKCIAQIHLQRRVIITINWWSRIHTKKKTCTRNRWCVHHWTRICIDEFRVGGQPTGKRATKANLEINRKNYCCIIIYLYWIPHSFLRPPIF